MASPGRRRRHGWWSLAIAPLALVVACISSAPAGAAAAVTWAPPTALWDGLAVKPHSAALADGGTLAWWATQDAVMWSARSAAAAAWPAPQSLPTRGLSEFGLPGAFVEGPDGLGSLLIGTNHGIVERALSPAYTWTALASLTHGRQDAEYTASDGHGHVVVLAGSRVLERSPSGAWRARRLPHGWPTCTCSLAVNDHADAVIAAPSENLHRTHGALRVVERRGPDGRFHWLPNATSWGERVVTSGGMESFAAATAADRTITAVWWLQVPHGFRLQTATYRPEAGRWTHVKLLGRSAFRGGHVVNVVSTPDGAFAAVWSGMHNGLSFARRNPSGRWSKPMVFARHAGAAGFEGLPSSDGIPLLVDRFGAVHTLWGTRRGPRSARLHAGARRWRDFASIPGAPRGLPFGGGFSINPDGRETYVWGGLGRGPVYAAQQSD